MKNKDINIIIVHKINKKIFVIDENIVNQQNTTTGKSKKKYSARKTSLSRSKNFVYAKYKKIADPKKLKSRKKFMPRGKIQEKHSQTLVRTQPSQHALQLVAPPNENSVGDVTPHFSSAPSPTQ